MVSRTKRALLVALAATMAVVGLSAVPASADITVNEVYTIPTSGTAAGKFTIIGRGYGHGHGLSQYGAQVAASKGLSAAQIVGFYYPGTSLVTKSTSTAMRVLLTSAPRDDLQVQPTATLAVRDMGDHGIAAALPTAINGKAISQWRLGVTPAGKTQVSYLQTTWMPYRTLAGDGEFFDSKLGYVTLLNPGPSRYAGNLLAASSYVGDLHRYTVNVLGLETYLTGVVPREMSPSWPAAALQSQAVAARTYALYEKNESGGRFYDICDSTSCQVYGGLGAQQTSSTNAVLATTSKYLSSGSSPAFTQFSASNAGWESAYPSAGFGYLPSKSDPYTPTPEEVYGRSYSWSYVRISPAPLQYAYPSIGTVRSITITGREGADTWKGRVISLTVTGSRGSVSLSGASFAAIFGLPSTWFTLEVMSSTS